MTKANKIGVLGKSYPFKFGMKFQRNFMNSFKIQKISDYQKKIVLLEKLETLEALDVLATFVISAINAGSAKPVIIDKDDLLDDLINNGKASEILGIMATAFKEANPNPNALGKSKK
jgi:hypothetical protein